MYHKYISKIKISEKNSLSTTYSGEKDNSSYNIIGDFIEVVFLLQYLKENCSRVKSWLKEGMHYLFSLDCEKVMFSWVLHNVCQSLNTQWIFPSEESYAMPTDKVI
jgi:hypothetical protein